MSLYLCHACLTWVERIADHCPECRFPVDAAVPDPTLGDLAETIGEGLARFGPVHLRRRHPIAPWGDWLVTSRGLFFGPLRSVGPLPRTTPLATSPRPPRSGLLLRLARLWTTLAGRTGAPPAENGHAGTWSRLHEGDSLDARRLAEWLMNDPGVFFVERDSLLAVRRTWSGWRILRRRASPVPFSTTSLRGVEPLGDASCLTVPPRRARPEFAGR